MHLTRVGAAVWLTGGMGLTPDMFTESTEGLHDLEQPGGTGLHTSPKDSSSPLSSDRPNPVPPNAQTRPAIQVRAGSTATRKLCLFTTCVFAGQVGCYDRLSRAAEEGELQRKWQSLVQQAQGAGCGVSRSGGKTSLQQRVLTRAIDPQVLYL